MKPASVRGHGIAKFGAECLRTTRHLGAKGGLFAEPLTLVESKPPNDAKVIPQESVMDMCTGDRSRRKMACSYRMTVALAGGGLIRCRAQHGLARDLTSLRTLSYRGLHRAALTVVHIV